MAVNQVPHFPFRLWPQNRVPDNDTGLTLLYILLYIRHGEQHLPSYAGYHYAMHSGGKKFFFYCFYRFGYDDFFGLIFPYVLPFLFRLYYAILLKNSKCCCFCNVSSWELGAEN